MFLKNKNISIVGGGLVGSLLSIYLNKQGANISVFDKRSDIRSSQYSGARSINLALSQRGIQALKKVGVDSSIMEIAMPMYKRIMHSVNGDLTEQSYGTKDQAIYSVSRKILNAKLIDIAEDCGVNFHFQKECLDIDFEDTKLTFLDQSLPIESDFIFGSDGAGSIIRKSMNKAFQDFNSMEKHIGYGYKELTILSNSDGSHKLANNALHIWPRKSNMIIALPNLDGTFTCTLFAPLEGNNSFRELHTKKHVSNFFSIYYNDLMQMVPDISEQYFNNPLSSLGFIRCSDWKKNNTFLIGDACHATVPFYGQGMNSGFEDCYLLNEWIDQYQNLNHQNIYSFLKERILNTTAMQELSIMNHIEMRDKTANIQFLLQKKIEHWFSNKHPDKWIPLYSMVTFSHMGYHQAMLKGKIQDNIITSIMKANNLHGDFSVQELEKKNIEQQILARMKKSSL